MSLSVTLSATAKSLINKYGDDIIINKVVLGAYDVTTGKTSETLTVHNAKGVYTDKRGENYDGVMTIHAFIDINLHDTINHNGVIRRIVNIVNVQTQNDVIIYEVGVTDDNKALR